MFQEILGKVIMNLLCGQINIFFLVKINDKKQ